MPYERKSLSSPTLSGRSLRAFTRLLEQRVSGRVVREGLHRQFGLDELRHTDVADWGVHAAHPASDGPVHRDAFDLAEAAVTRTPPTPMPTVADYARALRSGDTTPVAIAQRFLDALEASEAEPPLRAFIAQDRDDLRQQAEASAARHAAGNPRSVLDGVPIAIKDEVDLTGYATTAGTAVHMERRATADGTPVARLRRAGALLVGKANMHELGAGLTGINPHHGTARNPWDPRCITGGSSSGSAVSVACGLTPGALACDAGGSIRIPAALCGVVGLKATFGRISSAGAAPLVWTVAHTGPMGATVADAAALYAVMAGPDPADPNTMGQPPVALDPLDDHDLAGITVGVYPEWNDDCDHEVATRCRTAVQGLIGRGAQRQVIEIADLHAQRLAHLVIISTEMAAGQAPWYADHQQAYGLEARVAMALVRRLPAVDYIHALRLRARFTDQWRELFASGIDVVVTPATGATAVEIPDGAVDSGWSDMGLADRIMRYCPPGNLVGLPCVSVPAGRDSRGRPIGVQVIGPPWHEARVLRVAAAVEASFESGLPARWHPTL